jgi:alkanesulfonate monooxygenase SsuD/methylene tetrahydromethanopterin reductase-like flavin-dependent oxidoreductase (luciferase family)
VKFGLFSNSRRPDHPSYASGWDSDIAEIVAADTLGIEECWISEHEVPAELILCKAAALTRKITLGSAVRPLAYYHPLQVATEANACDHLTGGRYRLGIGFGFGATPKEMERRGLDWTKTREMMHASIDLILRLWTAKEPIDYDGPFWKGKGMELRPKSVQLPHPPVAVAVQNTAATAELAGAHGFQMLTSNFNDRPQLRRLGDAMVAAARKAGRTPSREGFVTCRLIYVAESDKEAREDMRESYNRTIEWEALNTPHAQKARIPAGGTWRDIDYDKLVDSGELFIGSPDTVRERITQFYEDVGGFGQIMIHGGRDYATPEKIVRSMKLFMNEVAPKLRKLGPDAAKPKAEAAE